MNLGKGLEGYDLAGVLGAFDGSQEELLRQLIGELDHDRMLITYIRKSNPTGHERAAHYLREQELMPTKIIRAGFPEHLVMTKTGDTGLSGALPREFRRDLDEIFRLIGEGIVGTIASADIARWFRDPSLKGPTEFVERAGRNNVRLITHVRGKLRLLRLEEKSDRETFVEEARAAANHRDKVREVTNKAKRRAASEGSYTGGPTPLGWRVEPGKNKYESGTGQEIAPRLVPYPPHAEVKFAIMRAAMLPHIKSYPALRRYLMEHEILVPPFEEEYRAVSFRRSVLRQVFTETPAGRVYLRPDETFVPTVRTLRNILLEPLVLGVKLYGSGEGGMYQLRRHLAQAAKAEVVPDSQLLPIRINVGTFEDQALCHTQEQIDLYQAVCRKWASVDLCIAWDLHQRTDKLEPNAEQTAGKPKGPPRGSSRINHWAGIVLCGRHGWTDAGELVMRRHMRLSGDRRTWQCPYDYATQAADSMCCNWGDNNAIGRILDTHLLRGIEYALRNDAAIIRSAVQGESAADRRMRLEQEVCEAQRTYEAARDELSKVRVMWEEIDREMAATEVERHLTLHVKPRAAIYAARKKELAKLDHMDGAPATGTEQEVVAALEFALANWQNLTVERKTHIISLLISEVVVFVSDGAMAREGLISFKWANGVTDLLIGWRGWFLDDRPWTPEEDTALRELWRSECPWEEIANRLQPRRRFNKIERRARVLGVSKGAGRTGDCENAVRASELDWHHHNPDVLYLFLEPGETPVECLAVTDRKKAEVIPIPDSVAKGVQFTLLDCVSRRRVPPPCLCSPQALLVCYSANSQNDLLAPALSVAPTIDSQSVGQSLAVSRLQPLYSLQAGVARMEVWS